MKLVCSSLVGRKTLVQTACRVGGAAQGANAIQAESSRGTFGTLQLDQAALLEAKRK